MKIKGFYTSTIGSFPLDDSEANRERCIKDLIDLGIDFPAYPQLTDMGKQFMDDLVRQGCGVIFEDGKYRMTGKSIGFVTQPLGLEPFLWTVRYVRERGLTFKVKAAITGPFTLASYIEVKAGVAPFNTALSDINLVEEIAQALSETCRIASRDASMISIDEPILGVIVGAKIPFKYSEGDVKRILNSIRNYCGEVITGIHVCGRISPKLAGILLGTNMDFLSHEFHDSPWNMKVYNPKNLRDSGKILSVGCVSSRNPRIESVGEILELMEMFRDYGDCLIFTPDCGFRNLIVDGSREKGYEVAVNKLRNMVEAIKIFRELMR